MVLEIFSFDIIFDDNTEMSNYQVFSFYQPVYKRINGWKTNFSIICSKYSTCIFRGYVIINEGKLGFYIITNLQEIICRSLPSTTLPRFLDKDARNREKFLQGGNKKFNW